MRRGPGDVGVSKEEFAGPTGGAFVLDRKLSFIPSVRDSPHWLPVSMTCAPVPGLPGGAPEPEPEQGGSPECAVLMHSSGPQLRFRALAGSSAGAGAATRLDAYKEQPCCVDLRPPSGHKAEKGAQVVAAVGLRSGDCLLVDPGGQRVLAHWNKDHLNAQGRCTAIAWDPRNPSNVVVAFASGAALVFDIGRAKEDSSPGAVKTEDAEEGSYGIVVTRAKSAKHNPASRWQVGKARINALCFSPPTVGGTDDGGLLAIATQDGLLRLLDMSTLTVTTTFKSYYGGLRCVDWSADGRCLVAGGEDDNLVYKHGSRSSRSATRCSDS